MLRASSTCGFSVVASCRIIIVAVVVIRASTRPPPSSISFVKAGKEFEKEIRRLERTKWREEKKERGNNWRAGGVRRSINKGQGSESEEWFGREQNELWIEMKRRKMEWWTMQNKWWRWGWKGWERKRKTNRMSNYVWKTNEREDDVEK